MADPKTYIFQLAGWLAQAIGQGRVLFADFTTEALGLNLPLAVVQSPQVRDALSQAEAAASNVETAGSDLEEAAISGGDLDIVAAFLELGVALIQFFTSLDTLVTSVRTNITAGTIPDPAARSAAEEFAENLAKILSDVILASAITDHAPQFGFLLRLLGLIDWRRVTRQEGNPLSNDYILRKLALHRFEDLINDPAEHYRQALGWGDPSFDPTDIFQLYNSFWADEINIEVGIEDGEPFLRQGNFRISRDSTTNPPGLRLSLQATLEENLESRVPINENWDANVASTFKIAGVITGRMDPPLSFNLLPVEGEITGGLRAFIDRNPAARPFDIVGGIGVFSLVADNLTVGAGLEAIWNPATGATIDPMVFVDLDKLTLTIGSSDADSFIGSLLASAEIEGEFDLSLEWQASSGLRVKASGGVEIALPIHKQLGPIELETIYLALRILSDGTLSTELSTELTGILGPLVAVVDRMGLLLNLRFAEDTGASYGPFDLDLKFKPPTGIGLAIDAGVVKGGGFLSLDFEKSEYAGALELTVANFLSLKAIGLINTKLPGGQTGFSLLIIITAEFNPGFQLGFGFTLIGVGGLLGLNRTLLLDPLVQGVRTGAVNSILFPTNFIANAPKIISDLRAIFPPEEGIFLIGPMAKVGWGTPTLVSVSLGVIIEIPGNVVILGRLRVALPTDEAAVLILQVSFVGALEFDKRRIWFFATMYESRVLFITLEGEMGLLMDFSDNPNFVLSVGGFHPRFTPPPLPFPSPAWIRLSIINESWARLQAETYFAVTSNSVQFGARADAFFGFDALSVEGYFSFDALLRFSPFYFIVEVSTGFSVKVFGAGLFGVHLRGSLEGPTPWHIQGSAEIEILFFSISVDVDVTFGEHQAETLPPIEVLPKLRAEYEKLESWRATLPASGLLYVSLRELGEEGALVLHPVGKLQISQRFAPLNLKMDKIGNQKPSDINQAAVSVTTSTLNVTGPTKEQFASAQYREMDDAAKLSAPAFEPLDSGVELSAAGQPWAVGPLAIRNVRYELIILDSAFKRFQTHFFKFWDGLFTHFRGGAAVTRVSISRVNEKRMKPFAEKMTVSPEQYTVAFQSDNTAIAATATFTSYAEAEAYRLDAVRQDATLFNEVHVIPAVEVNRG